MRNGIEERQKLHLARLAHAVDELLKKPDGRYFLSWLIQMTGTLEASYPPDHASAAFREGQRAVGCAVLALVRERGGAGKIMEVKNA